MSVYAATQRLITSGEVKRPDNELTMNVSAGIMQTKSIHTLVFAINYALDG
jgi:hypothetical protein